MRNVVVSLLALALGASLTLTALAEIKAGEGVPKGSLVIRYGDPADSASYKNEDTDINGNLTNVSAVCADGPKGLDAGALTQADQNYSGNKTVYKEASSTTLINAGAHVTWDPIKGSHPNPNHCLISNISVSKIKGAFH